MSDTNIIPVNLGDDSYNIHIGLNVLEQAGAILSSTGSYTSAIALTHPKLESLYAQPVQTALERVGVRTAIRTIPSGERYKNLRTMSRIYDNLLSLGADRKSLLITVGGGVIGDMGGFAAATWMRGIAFAQVPTTLLAQVDASVGGKTGVDLPKGKNLVGAFHQPRAVLIEPRTLSTLPARELRSGMAEMLKHGIICDKDYFNNLISDMPRLLSRNPESLTLAIRRSCEIKADVVSRDEREQGLRAVLNYGHTIGHAIEALTGYKRYLHGEAVAIGMVSASLVSEEMKLTGKETTEAIIRAIKIARLPWEFPCDLSIEDTVDATKRDKKQAGGKLTMALLEGVGQVRITPNTPEKAVLSALRKHISMCGKG